MSAHIADVKVERAGAPGRFFGICSCGWAGVPMAYRLDAKLEAMMHADFATLQASPPQPEQPKYEP